MVKIPSLSRYSTLLHMDKCGIISKCRNLGFRGQYWTFMKGPIVGYAGAMVENVEKEEEAPNWSLFCPKINDQQSELEAVPTKKDRV